MPLLGENWHNNHHASPRSASTWVFWYQVDFQYLLLRLLEGLGLVTDIVVLPPTKLRAGYANDASSLAGVFISWAVLAVLLVGPWTWWPRLRRWMHRGKATAAGAVTTAELMQDETAALVSVPLSPQAP